MAKRTSMIGIKVTEETRDKIEYLASIEDRSISTYINLVLQKHLNERNEFKNVNWKIDLEKYREEKKK